MNWLERIKDEARGRWEKLGSNPIPRDELWKYTNPSRLLNSSYPLVTRENLKEDSNIHSKLGSKVDSKKDTNADFKIDPNTDFTAALNADSKPAPWSYDAEFRAQHGKRGADLVFLNGHFAADLSDCQAVGNGIQIHSLAALAKAATTPHPLAHWDSWTWLNDSGFSLWNRAMMTDGYVIVVDKHACVEPYLRIRYVSDSSLIANKEPMASHLRNFVHLRENSRLKLMECYESWDESEHLTNAVTQVDLGKDATLDFCRVGVENPSSFHVNSTVVSQSHGSSLKATQFSFGNALARHDFSVRIEGDATVTELNGLSLASGKRHIDHHTTIDHLAGHGLTRQHYKGILTGESRIVFNGRIIIRKNSQKVDVSQLSNNLLLSSKAEADVVPQLQIDADDVKATHGATVGQLSDDELFYLQSRAIDPEASRRMIVRGFAWEIVEKITAGDLAEAAQIAAKAALEEMSLV